MRSIVYCLAAVSITFRPSCMKGQFSAGNYQFEIVERRLLWLTESSKRKNRIPMYDIKIKCQRMVGKCPVCPIGWNVASTALFFSNICSWCLERWRNANCFDRVWVTRQWSRLSFVSYILSLRLFYSSGKIPVLQYHLQESSRACRQRWHLQVNVVCAGTISR